MKVSKKIFSLALGLSVFATSTPTPGCFAMTADDTGHPEEEPGMFGNLFELLPDDTEGPVGNPERDHSSPPPSRSSSRSSDDETTSSEQGAPMSSSPEIVVPEERCDGETSEEETEGDSSSTPSSRSPSRLSDGEEEPAVEIEEEESVGWGSYSQPLSELRGEEGSVSGSNVPKFFEKTVDVAVVRDTAHVDLQQQEQFISRLCREGGNTITCDVEGRRRKVKFDLIDSNDLNRLKNYRIIVCLFDGNESAREDVFNQYYQQVRNKNTWGHIIFTSYTGECELGDNFDLAQQYIGAQEWTDSSYMLGCRIDYLKNIVERFDEADKHFSSLALTPSQRTGVKRGGIAAACVGGAWIAYKKISSKFKKPNQKKLKKQHKNDKKSEQNQIANA